jgi:hypothetical protein
MPKVTVYSIPHTGTKFACKFLHIHKISHTNRHYDRKGGIYEKSIDWKYIVPVRNPYLCYASFIARDHKVTDLQFLSMWARFIFFTSMSHVFYFPLDVKNRNQLLTTCVLYCGEEPNREIIENFSWNPVGENMTKEPGPCPQHMKDALKFAHEWYEHWTEHWSSAYLGDLP